MEESEERERVKRAQGGDRDAFRELVEQHQRQVYAIAQGVLKDHEAALDASQEVFVKVFRHLSRFKYDSTFKTWLFRIARNHCIDMLRKRQKRGEVLYEDAREIGEDRDETSMWEVGSMLEESPLKSLERLELRGEMLKALDGLSENHRTVLLLREVQGLSYDEIAEVMEISKGTVMSRLFHARRNFQALILPYLTGTEGGEEGE